MQVSEFIGAAFDGSRNECCMFDPGMNKAPSTVTVSKRPRTTIGRIFATYRSFTLY